MSSRVKLSTLAFLLFALAFLAPNATGQGSPFESTITQKRLATTIPGLTNLRTVRSASVVAFCNFPGNSVPCSHKATADTVKTPGTSCPPSTQVTLVETDSCVGTTDSRGSWVAWVPAGDHDFTTTVSAGRPFDPHTESEGIPTALNRPMGSLTTTNLNALGESLTTDNPCEMDGQIYLSLGGCYTSIQAAITALNGATGVIFVPPGIWSSASTITITASGQHLLCSGIGSTVISYTGSSAIAAVIDVGTASTNGPNQLDEVSINGCTISGNANVQYGIRLRGVHHSDFSHNNLINITTSGIYTNYAVMDQFNDEHTSFNEQVFTVQPQSCLYFDGTADLRTTGAQVDHPICEGVSGTGIVMNYCTICKISTGTSEQNDKGITLSTACDEDEIDNMDLESNTTSDLENSGSQITIIGGVSLSLTHILSTASRTRIIGGLYNSIALDSGAINTTLLGLSYNNYGDGTFTDNGTATTKIDITNANTGVKDTNYTGSTNFLTIGTVTNCVQNMASPADCGSAPVGVFAVPSSQTTYMVNTTAVTNSSRIHIQQITDNTGIPSSPTCSATVANPLPSGRTAGTSFTFALTSVAAITCFEYWMDN